MLGKNRDDMAIVAEKCKQQDRKKKVTATPIVIEKSEASNVSDNGEALICSKCGLIITFPGEKIEVNGAYHHSFANPHGLFFDISCFKNAPGCVVSYESSSEFTWFPGFSWQVAGCRTCLSHLGWFFSSAKSHFFGLISTSITEAGRSEE